MQTMSNSVTFQTQLASIMEVLANAAVAEICELVDNGYAVLHLEISRSQKENESLKRKLRLMEIKVARTSALRSGGISSSIFASSRARAHLVSESRRTPSLETQFQRGREFHLGSSGTRVRDVTLVPPTDVQTSTQKKGVLLSQPGPITRVTPKPPVIKMEKIDVDDVFEITDQQERLGASDHSAEELPLDSIVQPEASQTINKQEGSGQGNAGSCVWPSDETTKTLYSEPKNLNANKRSQSSDVESGDIPLDPVAFDCMLYESHSQHGPNSIPGPLAEDPGCSYSLKMSSSAGPPHSDHSSDFPFTVSDVTRCVSDHQPPAVYRDSRQREPLSGNESQMPSREDIDPGANAPFLIDDDGWVSSHNSSSNVPPGFSGGGADGLDKLFICSFCGKTLACLKNLKTHMRVHTGEKPFSCAQCGKRFSDSSNLKRHQSVHTGERRYGCMHCGKRFAQSGSLKVHMSVHTGCKQFKCPHCGKTFISANHLRRHISVHDGEKLPSSFQ